MTTLTLVRGATTLTPAPVLGDLTYTTIPAGLCREALHAYHVGFNRAAKRFSKLNPAPAVMHDDDTAPAAGTAARKALGEELAAAGRVWRAERHPMAHKAGMSDVRKFYRRRGDDAALAALVDPFGVIPARAAARTVAAMVESDRVTVVTVPAVPAARTPRKRAPKLTRCGGCGAYALPAGAAGPVCCTVPGAVALTWADVAPAAPAPLVHAWSATAGGTSVIAMMAPAVDVDGLPGWLADLPVRLRKPARRLLAARVREVGLDPRGDVWARAVAGELPGVVLPVRGDVDASVTA